MTKDLEYKSFSSVNLTDPFFDSLKEDYPGFADWYLGKAQKQENAYVNYINGMLEGFLYFKDDGNIVQDVTPELRANKILKIGTFKINPHRTRLGERFIKIALDHAVLGGYDLCYVTIFGKHSALIKLFEKYGFEYAGNKLSKAGEEGVYVKRFDKWLGDICKDYPLVKTEDVKKYLLSIYPRYHTVMFPDSKLNNESDNLIRDISHTNSIHKIYVCGMGVEVLNKGDIVVLYRTADSVSAEYSSVATSMCVVEEVHHQDDFKNFDEFYQYACKYSIFDKADLYKYYRRGGCRTVKMLYNIALPKRITRHDLIEKAGLPRDKYWGFMQISDAQFEEIMNLGKVNSDYVFS